MHRKVRGRGPNTGRASTDDGAPLLKHEVGFFDAAVPLHSMGRYPGRRAAAETASIAGPPHIERMNAAFQAR